MIAQAHQPGCTDRAPRVGAAVLVTLLAALCALGLLRSEPGRAPRQAAAALPLIAATLDIDTATARELEALPGIGSTLAQRIVDDRESRGPFGAVESLDRVRGIGPRTIDRLRPYLRASPPPPGGTGLRPVQRLGGTGLRPVQRLRPSPPASPPPPAP